MSSTCDDRIAQLLAALQPKWGIPDSVANIEKFPFSSFEEATSAILRGEYTLLRGDLTPALFRTFANSQERFIALFWQAVAVKSVLLLLVGSFFVENLYLLLGFLLFPVLLVLTTHQLERFARSVVFVMLIGSVFFWVNEHEGLAVLLSSLSLWLLGNLRMKTQYYSALYRRAMDNEKAFILALWGNSLRLADKNMAAFWQPPDRPTHA